MRAVFWTSLLLVSYAYAGYAVLLMVWARVRQRPVRKAAIQPRISVVIAACNEERTLPGKIANLQRMEYPAERMEIVIASDGSTDGTAELLRSYGAAITPVVLPEPRGKAVALNAAVRQARGEILLFLDARQMVDADAAAELASCFADPTVGAVSGELLLEDAAGGPSPHALGLYWKIEKVVRRLESATGSVVGVTGAIYAMRRELYTEIPPGTILDDVFVPMGVARRGLRVIFEPRAIARDVVFAQKGKEFGRKVRTLTGNYQLLRLAPWLLTPGNPLLLRFISHKMLRLVVPLLLLLLLGSSAMVPTAFFRVLFGLQVVFYLLAALGTLGPAPMRFKPVAIASTFVMLNAAAVVALYNFLAGRSRVWVR